YNYSSTLEETRNNGIVKITYTFEATPISELQTITVHVSETLQTNHRAMFSFSPLDKSWTPRLTFQAFKNPGVDGTIKVSVGEANDPHRTMVSLKTPMNHNGWTERLVFYAYETEQPDTEMVSVGQAQNPHRCMVVKGQLMNFAGWTEKFHFWVPK
ncbi:hypothetical protein RUND412_006113, partial [Rhizina undulata]